MSSLFFKTFLSAVLTLAVFLLMPMTTCIRMFVVFQGEDGVLHEGKRDSARAAAGGSGHPLRL